MKYLIENIWNGLKQCMLCITAITTCAVGMIIIIFFSMWFVYYCAIFILWLMSVLPLPWGF